MCWATLQTDTANISSTDSDLFMFETTATEMDEATTAAEITVGETTEGDFYCMPVPSSCHVHACLSLEFAGQTTAGNLLLYTAMPCNVIL